MKKFLYILAVVLGCVVTGCDDAPEYRDTPTGNFDALWQIVDSRYCFFKDKDIDWEKIGRSYRTEVTDRMNDRQLFDLCAAMLDELQDGHVNLSSSFDTSYYRKWWSDYPQNFNLRTLQQYYLGFEYGQTSGISYKMMTPDSIGYVYYPSFSSGIGKLNLDYVMLSMWRARGLIVDVRNNGGGLLTNVETLVSRFIYEPMTGGYIIHKTGPGHDDFSEPYRFTFSPVEEKRIPWNGGPVIVLTNRACFSAANDFVSVMKTLPNVIVMGARTGGGGGMPFSSELPNGWSVRLSASPITDPEGNIIEDGVDPTPGFEVSSPDEELARGKDRILDTAIELLRHIASRSDGPEAARRRVMELKNLQLQHNKAPHHEKM